MAIGITQYDGYLPRLRLSRAAIADANAWMSPALRGQARGTRTMAGWDEDSLTLAVEAGRRTLQGCASDIVDGLYLASTTLPYEDRSNAGMAAAAMGLRPDIHAVDMGGSQRAATSALISALAAVRSGIQSSSLVIAAETPRALAGSPQEMQYGDGAAALLLGSENIVARYLGCHTLNEDFIDHFRGRGETFDYYWEDRWIRDEGWQKIVPKAILQAMQRTGVQPDRINRFIMACPYPGVVKKIAKKAGLEMAVIQGDLSPQIGDARIAQPLLMLGHALEQCRPGEILMLVSFGQGCDVLLLEATDAVTAFRPSVGLQADLDAGCEETNYMKFLVFNDLLKYYKGMRAEFDRKVSLSAVHRQQGLLSRFIGGYCEQCKTPQIPAGNLCVACGAADSQQPHSFADKQGRVLSWSADFLSHSIDPPSHYGMIEFTGGGRLMMDITDVDAGEVCNDLPVSMVYRIKDIDSQRGYRRYFWKARPVQEKTSVTEN